MAAVALAGSTSAQAAGPEGVGDPFFPLSGNLGYQVLHYDLRLTYAPASGRLQGDARIRARTRRRLRRFHLDFRHLAVRQVRVNGDRARFRRSGQELIIAPRRALRGRRPFSVRIEYAGTPRPLRDADGAREGWIRTSDGAFVVAEPRGAPTWFPCNDHPRDKATYRFALTVPRRLHAVANGRLRSVRRGPRTRTWVWRARQPMASYLAMVDIGLGPVRKGRVAGVPSWITVDPFYGAAARPLERKLGRVMRFLERYFGPYPFDSTGVVIDRAGIGYALESQTRPFFDGRPSIYTLVHEIAHQWYGNSVTLRAWPQIWLNEGFATWAELFWQERHGGPSVRTAFRRLYRTPARDRAFWNPPPGRLESPDLLFDQTVYIRGAMALQALRQKVGNATFFGILRGWARERRHGHGTIRGFIALAERRSRVDLGRLFRVWLFTPGKPGRQAARR